MNRTPVESSFIAAVGYENGILEVEFKNGQVHRGECPEEYFIGLTSPDTVSVGKYFNAIKTKITMTKVEREEAAP